MSGEGERVSDSPSIILEVRPQLQSRSRLLSLHSNSEASHPPHPRNKSFHFPPLHDSSSPLCVCDQLRHSSLLPPRPPPPHPQLSGPTTARPIVVSRWWLDLALEVANIVPPPDTVCITAGRHW